jgi:hypothetical protein
VTAEDGYTSLNDEDTASPSMLLTSTGYGGAKITDYSFSIKYGSMPVSSCSFLARNVASGACYIPTPAEVQNPPYAPDDSFEAGILNPSSTSIETLYYAMPKPRHTLPLGPAFSQNPIPSPLDMQVYIQPSVFGDPIAILSDPRISPCLSVSFSIKFPVSGETGLYGTGLMKSIMNVGHPTVSMKLDLMDKSMTAILSDAIKGARPLSVSILTKTGAGFVFNDLIASSEVTASSSPSQQLGSYSLSLFGKSPESIFFYSSEPPEEG